nr:COP9 signalosome complex subunit 12 [Cryptococcus depauperatus CBS 7841]
MKYSQFIQTFVQPLQHEDINPLLRSLTIHGRSARGIADTVGAIEGKQLKKPGHALPEPWDEMVARHCACVYALYKKKDYTEAFNHQNTMLTLFYRWFVEQSSWVLPVLYMMLNDLRDLAEQADQETFASTGKTPSLEIATRTVSKAFSLCATDRFVFGKESRRQGVFHTAILSLKCYFKINKPNLCKNVIRAVTSDPKTPSVETAPLNDQVAWHFYLGMLAFLNGEDRKADEQLGWSLGHCPTGAVRNQELILTYLIPLKLLRGSFPSPVLLNSHPRLKEVFEPFIEAIKAGDIQEYDRRLEWAQLRLVGMNVWLVVERAREGCLRMLFKKAWIVSDKSSRIPLSTFQLALKLHGVEVEADEMECMVANMIYRGYLKGYISHEKKMVVLAKANPFPKMATIAR